MPWPKKPILYNLFIITCMMSCTGGMCHTYLYRYLDPLEFNGFVINKYLDSTYKYAPSLIIKINSEEHSITSFGNDTIFWSKVSIGDTLIKKNESLDFMIISKGETSYQSIDNCNSVR